MENVNKMKIFLQYNKTFQGHKYKFDNKYFLTL